jgi:hypothetical protein
MPRSPHWRVRMPSTSTHRLSCLLTLLWASACKHETPTPEPAAATIETPSPKPQPDLHREATFAIDRLMAKTKRTWWPGEGIPDQAAFDELVGLGADAVPTILYFLAPNDDPARRRLLTIAAIRIGDVRALPVFDQLADDTDRTVREEAIEAIGKLGRREALPRLRERLATADDAMRVPLLAAMLRLGDSDVIGELLHIGLHDGSRELGVSDALAQHLALRLYAGLGKLPEEGEFESFSVRRFLELADEWHHERVLQRPSPWRSSAPETLGPPFADAKQSAFKHLTRHAHGYRLRVDAVDPVPETEIATQPLLRLFCEGHGGYLIVEQWAPTADGFLSHRFESQVASLAHDFGDGPRMTYRRFRLPTPEATVLLVGLRTIFAASLREWWSGADTLIMLTTRNVGLVIGGIDGSESQRFCGYLSSAAPHRQSRLLASHAWFESIARQHALEAAATFDADARRCFVAMFRAEQPAWTSDWWFVREHMVAMAGHFGDRNLCEPLRRYLTPSFVSGDHSMKRTAAAAIESLARLTGVDLRTDANGRPKAVTTVAADYERLLADGAPSTR